MSNVQLGYTQVIDPISFKSIPSGKIYIGEYGTLPNPAVSGTWKQAYFVNSDGTRTAASQPIRTNAAGFAVDGSGNIKTIQVDGGYSLLVQDQLNVTKFSQACSSVNDGAVLEFDTIAGFTGALDGSVCYFKGRDTVGDGGGGHLRFLAGSTATADGVTIYSVPGGRLVREGWSVFGIDVRWAGADATGVEDSRAEIQSALNLGGEVRLPGKFRCTSTLYITKPGTSLVGRGWASVIGSTSVQEGSDQLIYEGTGYAISVAPSGASDIERVCLKGFAITGSGINDGVYVENCRHSEFNNVYITNVRDCWYFNDTDWQNKMTRCQGMSFSRYGIYANSSTEDSMLDTCIFRGYGAASVGLYVNYYASTLTAVNCDFSDNKTNVVLNLGLSSVDGVFTFKGCQFEGGSGGGSANHVGVQLVSSSEGTVAIFEGCRWTHTDAANRASAKAILADAAKSLVVRGARVTNIGTFIDIPTAANIGRLEVTDVIGSGVTTAFANQASSVTNRIINNVLSEPNNDSIYREGTFTPTVVGTSTSGTGTYTTQLGFWRRVGNVVHFNVQCTWTAHTGTGNLQINGLPFASAAIGTAQPVSVFMSDIALSANNVMQCFIGSGVSSIAIRQVPTGGGASAVIPMDAAGTIAISGTYFVAG